MEALIVFGNGPSRLDIVQSFVKEPVYDVIFTGTTIDEVVASGPTLKVETPVSPCTVIFDHFMPGQEGIVSTDEDCANWKNGFWKRLVKQVNNLSTFGFTQADMPKMDLSMAKSDSSASFSCTWENISTTKCILFARAIEAAYNQSAPLN